MIELKIYDIDNSVIMIRWFDENDWKIKIKKKDKEKILFDLFINLIN